MSKIRQANFSPISFSPFVMTTMLLVVLDAIPGMAWFVGGIVALLLLVGFIVSFFSKFLIKSTAGHALVKTGFGLKIPSVNMSSTFVVPLLNRVEAIDLTVKIVNIKRRQHDSLSCADGIRAEVEVDFYVQINPIEDDIRRVANTIGCARASNINTLRELFEAKFSDALKTAGSKLTFDQLYQNRALFREEILKALGQTGAGDVVLNGYRLDDVAIQYLEQLPLAMHNADNVLDAKGRKVIAERTSAEAEAANERLRQREITIAEQNRVARIRDLEIKQQVSEKEATQAREVREIQARQNALTETTIAEQDRLALEAQIARDQSVKIAEERKQQEVLTAQIARERTIQVAEQEKQREIEIARIQREIAEAEAQKEKIRRLEEIARQEAERIRAEEQAATVKALEIANRQKQIEVIQAEKDANVQTQKLRVDSDVRAYEITTVAKAKLDAAQLETQAAEMQAKNIVEIGRAEADARRMKLEAENSMNRMTLLAQALNQIIPMLPEICEKLMLPAEKIESIKVLNVNGLEGLLRNGNGNGHATVLDATPMIGGGGMGSNPTAGIMQTVLSMGMVMPLLREVMGMMKGDAQLSQTLRDIPGGEQLLSYLEKQ